LSRNPWVGGIMLASVRRFFAYFLSLLFLITSASAEAQVGPRESTKLVFYNASNADVVVLCSHPALPTTGAQEDGCATGSVVYYKVIDLTENTGPQSLIMFQNPALGWFKLKRGHKVQFLNTAINPYTGSSNYCLQGTIFGFGQNSATCPDSVTGHPAGFPDSKPGPNFGNLVVPPIPLPNGSNGFEATLNLPGTIKGVKAGGNQEAVDITCVNGANCTLSVQIVPPPGGPYWSGAVGFGSQKSLTAPFTFKNSWVNINAKCDDNCVDPNTGYARPGVFPYGCTQCNKPVDPAPPCVQNPNVPGQFCAAKNGLPGNTGCQFARVPQGATANKQLQTFGGTIICTYLGPLAPPKTCPRR
jgi:hypothetical protein